MVWQSKRDKEQDFALAFAAFNIGDPQVASELSKFRKQQAFLQ